MPISLMAEPKKPSAWRSANLNTLRSMRLIRIAASVRRACPSAPNVCQSSQTPSSNHRVKLPRLRELASHYAQFRSLNAIYGMGYRRSALCLLGMVKNGVKKYNI